MEPTLNQKETVNLSASCINSGANSGGDEPPALKRPFDGSGKTIINESTMLVNPARVMYNLQPNLVVHPPNVQQQPVNQNQNQQPIVQQPIAQANVPPQPQAQLPAQNAQPLIPGYHLVPVPQPNVALHNILAPTQGPQGFPNQPPPPTVVRTFKRSWLERLGELGKRKSNKYPQVSAMTTVDNLSGNVNRLHKTKIKSRFFYRLRKAATNDNDEIMDTVHHDHDYTMTSKTFKDIVLRNKYDVLSNVPIEEAVTAVAEDENIPEDRKKDFVVALQRQDPNHLNRAVGLVRLPTTSHNVTTITDQIDIECDTSELEKMNQRSNEIKAHTVNFTFPVKRKKLNKKRIDGTKTIKAFDQLLWYLKTKHAFAAKTLSLVTTLRNDARVWMATNNFKMDNEEDYNMMTNAVLAAMVTDNKDLQLREVLKVRKEHNIRHVHNRLMLRGIITKKFNPNVFGRKVWRGADTSFFKKTAISLANNVAPL
ncbi:hypothetical protein 1 [Wenzhou tombus-like virus 14]|uniref:hypothetical protein 1 n=1 Tax=Wenzhou tombus-like virus 14 TaxID=1923667 RepID=UPI00090B59FD|nr:hypothetical protein 1 [Wenzhou tombus-like virus 14]APG76636.1 hypothetical protein 1 [Wenzhou tombus-like virus 14]